MICHFESSKAVKEALELKSVRKLLSLGLSLGVKKSYADLCIGLKSKDDNELFHLASNVLSNLFFEAQTIPWQKGSDPSVEDPLYMIDE